MEPTDGISWQIAETPEEKEICFQLRSKGYRRYYRHIPPKRFIDPEDVELLPNGCPRSMTVAMCEPKRVVGTGRAVLYHAQQFPTLRSELDNLFAVDRQRLIAELEDASRIAPIRTIGELGRFTLVKPSNSDLAILRMFQGYARIMEIWNVDIFIAIAFPWMKKRMAQVGIELNKMEKMHLNRNDIDALLFMVRYFDYFFPRLNMVLPDVEDEHFTRTTRMTLFELRSVIDSVYPLDVVHMYWISPENVRQAIAAIPGKGNSQCSIISPRSNGKPAQMMSQRSIHLG